MEKLWYFLYFIIATISFCLLWLTQPFINLTQCVHIISCSFTLGISYYFIQWLNQIIQNFVNKIEKIFPWINISLRRKLFQWKKKNFWVKLAEWQKCVMHLSNMFMNTSSDLISACVCISHLLVDSSFLLTIYIKWVSLSNKYLFFLSFLFPFSVFIFLVLRFHTLSYTNRTSLRFVRVQKH